MKDIDFYKRLSNYLLDCENIECADCEFNTGEDFSCNIFEITSESISDLIEEIEKLNKDKEKIIESARDSFSWCFGCKKTNNCGYIDKCNSNNDFYESIWN